MAASVLCLTTPLRLVTLLALLTLGVDAARAQSPVRTTHKVQVSGASATRLAESGGRLIADYGAFQIYEIADSDLTTLTKAASTGSGDLSIQLRDDLDTIKLNAGAIDTSAPDVQATWVHSARLGSFPGKRLHLVHFVGPVKPAWREELEKTGAQVIDYLPDNAYLVYGDAATLGAIQTPTASPTLAAALHWEGAYADGYKIHPLARTMDAEGRPRRIGTPFFIVQMVADKAANPATVGVINQWKRGDLVRWETSLNRYYNVVAEIPADGLPRIAAMPDVISIQPYFMPHKADERQDQIVAGNLLPATGQPNGPGYLAWLASKGFTQDQFTASGFAVDVTDSGIDNATITPNHFGLYTNGVRPGSSRVLYNRLEGSANSGSTLAGQDGHGNLNAHIIGGYDNGSSVNVFADDEGYRYGLGVAPFVKMGSSVIFDPSSFTRPNYPTLQSDAYASGARVSSNSWGGNYNGYIADCQTYDGLVRDAQAGTTGNQEMVIVFAADNFGPAAHTVGIPGNAKNVITVGASENVQPFGSDDHCGYTDADADNANDVASYSSRGPCADGRMKPDLVAPGTHISGGVWQAGNPAATGTADPAFTGSDVCGGADGSLFFPGTGTTQQLYTASNGTSHSTPAVSGGCALLRQCFINQGFAPPSPAMTKAVLLNGARYLTGTGTNDSLPSSSQGMGEMNLNSAFGGTAYFHRDQLADDLFTATGQTRTFTVSIPNNYQGFRVTLAWTDAPGSTTGNAYNNDLDLTVTAGGATYKGNVFSGAYSAAGGSADKKDNVESVFLPGGINGDAVITVTAANIVSVAVPGASGTVNQDFALVAFPPAPQPAAVSNGSALAAESATPANGWIDPGEVVTLSFTITNTGNGPFNNLIARLQEDTVGVRHPSSAQSYGAIPPGGSVTRNFTFTATGVAGGAVTPILVLSDGATSYGTLAYGPYTLGHVQAVGTTGYANPSAITINDHANASPYPASVTVSGLSLSNGAYVSNVTLSLNGVTHPSLGDVDALLVGPTGRSTLFLSNVKGVANNATYVFDDTATASLPTVGGATASGTFLPTVVDSSRGAFSSPGPSAVPYATTFAGFNNQDPNGTWSLYLRDSQAGSSGSVANGFTLAVSTSTVNVADTSTDLVLTGSVYPSTAVAGQRMRLSFSVFNRGMNPATGVDVFVNLPAYPVISTTQTQGSYEQSSQYAVFHFGSIGKLTTATGTITLSIPSATANSAIHLSSGINPFDQLDTLAANNVAPMDLTVHADSDGDGIPDDYETSHGLNPNDPTDAAPDSDGDGMGNLAEYLAGTNPQNPASVLRITSVTRDANTGAMSITFPSVSGVLYRAQYTDDLSQPSAWSLWQDNIPGTGQVITLSDGNATAKSKRFYRLQIVPP